jgi:hypothetical protein
MRRQTFVVGFLDATWWKSWVAEHKDTLKKFVDRCGSISAKLDQSLRRGEEGTLFLKTVETRRSLYKGFNPRESNILQ